MQLHNRISHFYVLATLSEDFSLLSRDKMVEDVGSSLKEEKVVGTAACDCLSDMDDPLWYGLYFLFDRLHSLIFNRILD